MYGFTFRGRHCSEFGVQMLRYTVHSPELREYESDRPSGGMIDYGTEYAKREIEVVADLLLSDRPLPEFKRRQSEILTWLKPTIPAGILVFDDVPDRYYYAKLSGRLLADQIGNYGEFQMTFKCVDPYAYGADRVVDGEFSVSPAVITVTSQGSEPTPPAITITNVGSAINGMTIINTISID